ncbi:hypothetical protein [Pseudoalteromonas piscicida]|uniref:hypothetical protein n=1 Tax=Pseudoalteromonas piscicida TaxID=43662 RepID=UPI000E358977|nr:hypothetical protein [Pseudoalteromonas piscicida]AXQ96731.1 hypothetical protein D0N37_02305 [Pseudoalteromonas piscicida]
MDYLRQYNDLNILYEALKKANRGEVEIPETTTKWFSLVESTLFELQELAYMQKSRTMNNLIELVYASVPTSE